MYIYLMIEMNGCDNNLYYMYRLEILTWH